MKPQVDFYASMIKNITKHKSALNFLFSHFPKDTDMKDLMSNIIKFLNPQELLNQKLHEVLIHMEERGQKDELIKIDPLDSNHLKVLQKIMSTKGIKDPKQAFNLNIMERSRSYLDR